MTLSRVHIRILFGIALLIVALGFPWYVTLIAALIGVFAFHPYIEVLLLGIILDALFGIAGGIIPIAGMYFLTAVLLLFVSQLVRRSLRLS